MTLPLAFGLPGTPELIVILIIGLLLFGSRLPEVGRSVGRSLMEFKRGLRGLQDEVSGLDHEADARVDAELHSRRNEPLPASPSAADGGFHRDEVDRDDVDPSVFEDALDAEAAPRGPEASEEEDPAGARSDGGKTPS